ncbi:efflux RND transporter periplasmic adaptor subunit [Nocardioides cavernaquae]|uniref:Efflux RND transporter periplasmic adaptor subunit n=1 Tax=Nocardioides cavernaquae TaxID=2321396 RepID=A0A3A5H813_9ACTN|nr:efflux RND transporter periplasmic adaptor subunit [Nocardioides cavernaquae]RJS45545.1 efflux RND transporter periplasmic adaptor subunit [Nocardioides cavernaquae]
MSGRARRRTALAAVAAIVALVIGLVAATSSAGASRYRTATAVTGDVEQTVGYDGTIAASRRRDLSFGAGGTVASVGVEPGDRVKAGQVLARLDTTDLSAAVTEAQADLAAAKATLEDVEDGQVDAVTGDASTASASPASATGSLRVVAAVATRSTTTQADQAATSPELAAQLAALAKQQAAVTSSQTAATEAIAAAKDALAAQTSACASPETDPTGAVGIAEECSAALAAVQDAQEVVAARQEALQSALDALSSTLNEAVAALGKSTTEPGGPTPETPGAPSGKAPEAAPQTPDAPSGNQGSGDNSSRSATAADLASAQAAIDVARAKVTQAEADLDAALLTAPFAGTIRAVDIAAGDDVATSDRAMVLIGTGDTTATASVPVDDLAALEVGQRARVVAGTGDPIAATVSSIGLAPEPTTDGSSATYRVTVTLDDETTAPEGTTVRVEVVTETAAKAVTVPVSAVTPLSAATGTVRLVQGEQVTRTRVTLGARGDTSVAITDGLAAGDLVVLADLEAELPSGGTQTRSTLRIGGGGTMTGPPPGMGSVR